VCVFFIYRLMYAYIYNLVYVYIYMFSYIYMCFGNGLLRIRCVFYLYIGLGMHTYTIRYMCIYIGLGLSRRRLLYSGVYFHSHFFHNFW
jgi:hypothetical protein